MLALCTGPTVAQAPVKPRPQPAKPAPQAPAAPLPLAVPQDPPVPPRFEIQRFLVEGNTLLKQSELDGILTPFSGKNRDFGDIQRALEALQDAYTGRGYNAVRVSIPEQDIRAGQVRLRVVRSEEHTSELQ